MKFRIILPAVHTRFLPARLRHLHRALRARRGGAGAGRLDQLRGRCGVEAKSARGARNPPVGNVQLAAPQQHAGVRARDEA